MTKAASSAEEHEGHHVEMDAALGARCGRRDPVRVARAGEHLVTPYRRRFGGEGLPVRGPVTQTDQDQVDVVELLHRDSDTDGQPGQQGRGHVQVAVALVGHARLSLQRCYCGDVLWVPDNGGNPDGV